MFQPRNVASAADPQYVNVLGLRTYARARTSLIDAATAIGTSITVGNARMFRVDDNILIGAHGTALTEAVVATIDLDTNVITLDGAVGAEHAVGTRVVGPWHDFGHVRNPTREQDLTELDIQSARFGRLATVKKLTTGVDFEFTFESISVYDRETIAWHSGGAATLGVIGGAGAVAAVEEFAGNDGELLFVYPNAEPNGNVKIAYYPFVTLKGDGEEAGDGENESSLTFRATVLQDDLFRVPTTLSAANPVASYGMRYITTPATLQEVLDIIDGADDEGEGEGEGEE